MAKLGDPLVALHRLARSLAPPDVAVAVVDPRRAVAAVWPQEAPAIAQAVPKRRREFAAGRHCARAAMKSLGVDVQAVPSRADRSAHWPAGLIGSISHDASSCIAILGHSGQFRGLGIDVEAAADLPQDLLGDICVPAEIDWLMTLPARQRLTMARRIFCAKEAVFKAQFPLSGIFFGFDAVHIQLNPMTDGFVATFRQSVGQIAAATQVSGQCGSTGRHLLALVTLGAAQGMENANFPVCATR